MSMRTLLSIFVCNSNENKMSSFFYFGIHILMYYTLNFIVCHYFGLIWISTRFVCSRRNIYFSIFFSFFDSTKQKCLDKLLKMKSLAVLKFNAVPFAFIYTHILLFSFSISAWHLENKLKQFIVMSQTNLHIQYISIWMGRFLLKWRWNLDLNYYIRSRFILFIFFSLSDLHAMYWFEMKTRVKIIDSKLEILL